MANVFRMMLEPMKLAADTIDELERTIEQLLSDHGMEPYKSEQIVHGQVPKYSQTIRALITYQHKLRRELNNIKKDCREKCEEITRLTANNERLQELLNEYNAEKATRPDSGVSKMPIM